MNVVDLNARSRTGRGKGYRNRLKAQGLVPAVVYGKELGSLPIELENRAVENILNKGSRNMLISLKVDPGNGRARKFDAIIKEVQFHPYKNEIFHVDFQQISLKEELTTNVGLRLVGEAPGAKAGGRLEQLLWEIEVSCLPQDIPDYIRVDVSGLEIGDSLHVADLTPPKGVKFMTDGEVTVVTVTAPRQEGEAPEEAAEETPKVAPAPEAE
jgi:large subunit ribosomal protein L25